MTTPNAIIGHRKDGSPILEIRGGSEGATEATGAADAGAEPAKGSEATEDGKEGRAGGAEALKADLAGERKARQELQSTLDGFMSKFQGLFGGEKGDPASTADDLARKLAELEANQKARDEAAQSRVIRAEVRSAATRLNFHDAADALARLDLAKVPLEDGEVDVNHIETELAAIAKSAPYLVKTGAASATDVGLGGGTGDKPEPKNAKDRIAAGLAAADSKRKN